METIWKPIPNYSRYEASNDGRLRSINYKNSRKVVELKPNLDNRGYLKTMLLRDDGKYISLHIHRFVAFAWIGECPDKYQVNHIDGVKTNNCPSNLEYVTLAENISHAYRMKLIKPKSGVLNGMAKLTDEDVLEIRRLASIGGRYYGRKSMAKKYGISESHVKDIVNRRRNIWQDV